jgi:pimeloyl-ACP methyl ester carboxylesterase
VTFDGRGNGRSDHPTGPAAYTPDEFAADALAVMDATRTERATLVALSSGALWGTILAADHPDRIDAIVYIGPGVTLITNHPKRDVSPFEDAIETDPEWAKAAGRLVDDYIGFVEFFFSKCFTEPHSSKQIEDCIGWAMQTTPETIRDTVLGIGMSRQELFTETCARVRCPTLVIHGDEDRIRPVTQGAALAEAAGS